MADTEGSIFEFGPFRFDERDRLLLKDGSIVSLTPKSADTLLLLLSHAGHVVERDHILRTVWPGTFVEEGSLTRNISQLRKVLGDEEPYSYIETIPKRGYRFVAEVRRLTDEPQSLPLLQDSAPEAVELPKEPPRSRTGAKLWFLIAPIAAVLGVMVIASTYDRSEPQGRLHEFPFTALPGGEYEPVFSPDGSRIAFVWNGLDEKHFGIYVKPVAGGNLQQLVSDTADEGSPAWSPDGKSIAFVRYGAGPDCGVYLINAAGGSERKLASLFPLAHIVDRKLDWSPDGSLLAFVDKSSPEEPTRIDILDAKTGERRRFTSPPPGVSGDSSPVFSPDGHKLAFKRTRSSSVTDLFVAELKSQEVTRLTWDNRHISALDWTPDGNEIILVSHRSGSAALWRVFAKGGTPQPILGAGGGATFLTVARKGRRAAYSRWFADTNIWQIAAPKEGSAPVPARVIASTRSETSPQYSPDNSRIAFRSDQSGTTEIWVSGPSGENMTQLTRFGGPLTGSPRWSPDGRRIAFDSRADGTSNIYVIDASGGEPKRVTTGPAENVVPSWSRDGKWIYFASTRLGRWEVWKQMIDQPDRIIQLTRSGGFAAFESPDGTTVYYAKGANSTGLWRVPSAGGQEEELLPDLKLGYWGCWGIAADAIYYIDPHPGGGAEIRKFDPKTRRSASVISLLRDPPVGDSGFAVSRDGSKFLVTQTDSSGSDITIVENFQ